MNKYTALSLTFRIYALVVATCLFLTIALLLSSQNSLRIEMLIFPAIYAFGGIPGSVVFLILLFFIRKSSITVKQKMQRFFTVAFAGVVCYSVPGAFVVNGILPNTMDSYPLNALVFFISFGLIVTASLFFFYKPITIYFSQNISNHINHTQTMETQSHIQEPESRSSNAILIKGVITGALILCMLIPMVYINELVREREQRHGQIAEEVSSKWASSQTLSGPLLFVPYTSVHKLANGTLQESPGHFWITPDQLTVNGTVEHEIRERSIYKVLLYRAQLADTGRFVISIPSDVDTSRIKWKDARICFGLSDFKGIEERLSINIRNSNIELSPGIPADDLINKGLSAPLDLSAVVGTSEIPFNMKISLRGSRQLHFLPLGGNSNFTVKSSWPDPSFDGNSLPGDRVVTADGFYAKWNFNKANLPFGTILKDVKSNDLSELAFGVTMLEAADHYAKTSRSVKYAILFIGLTFALFFIIELMQKKPFHPVQYALIGLALIIFYALLLSISEFMPFDLAYVIASSAIILMITLYAFSHFKSWASASIFFGVLTALYGFIFVLVRLEDTALLVGSIGLFIVLALVMYFSRRIRWYGNASTA